MKKTGIFVGLIAGCTAPDTTSTSIAVEPNELGVTSLVSERFTEDGNQFFTLTGLDAAAQQVARVQQEIGIIPGLSQSLPGADDFGAALVIDFHGHNWRAISRDIEATTIPMLEGEDGYRTFFRLPAVEAALHAGHIEVEHPAVGERALDTEECSPSQLLNTMTAAQCCWTTASTGSWTWFKATSGPNNGKAIRRWASPYGPCKSSTGGSCSGNACYYGPNGFSMPQIWDNSESWNINVYVHSWTENWETFYEYYCGANTSGGDIQFPDVMGSNAMQNCPGGNGSDGTAWAY